MNKWIPIIVVGGIAVVGLVAAVYLFNKKEDSEMPPAPALVEPYDPQYLALVEFYRQQNMAPYNIYKQILPQSDVLRYDPNFDVWRYKWGTFPGYDPSPYQAYSLPPQWGTDPYWFDPFGQRFSDFDV